LGKQEEHSYNNTFGELVSWKFVDLTRIYEILDETIYGWNRD